MKSFKILILSLSIFSILFLIPSISKADWKGYTTVANVKVYSATNAKKKIGTIINKGYPIRIKSVTRFMGKNYL